MRDADAPGRRRTPLPRCPAESVVYAVLAVIVLVVYRAVFAVDFLNEDYTWLWQCRLAAPTTVWRLLTTDVMGGLYSWRPVVQLSFGLNEAVWGLHVFGYRLEVLAWQALAAGLLYAIVAPIAGRLRGVLAAVFFAVHPIHVESLSWTCARGGPIATAWLLLGLRGYMRWRQDRGRRLKKPRTPFDGLRASGNPPANEGQRAAHAEPVAAWGGVVQRTTGSRAAMLAWVVVPFVVAIATLETSIVFIGLVCAVDLLLPANESRCTRWPVYAGLIAVAAGHLWLRHAKSPASTTMGMVGLDVHWPLSALQALLFAAGKLLVVARMLLTLDDGPAWLTGLLVVAAVLGVLWCWRRGHALGMLGLVWIVLASAPFTLLLLGPAARHLHLATVGFGLLCAELVATGTECVARSRVALMCAAALMLLCVGRMVAAIDRHAAQFVERGHLAGALLADLRNLVPRPRPGSELAFYGLGPLRVQRDVFVFGFDDAVHLIYDDGSLRVYLGARGSAPQANYHLAYEDGHLVLLAEQG